MTALVTFANRWGEIFAQFSYSMLLQSSLLIAVLAALDFALRKRTRAVVRYALWMLLLLKLVLPVNLSSPTALVTVTPTLGFSPAEQFLAAPQRGLSMTPPPAEWIEPATFLSPPPPEIPNLAPAEPQTVAPTAPPHIPLSPFGIALAVWALLASGLLARVALKIVALRRLVDQSAPANPQLLSALAEARQLLGIHRQLALRLVPNNITPALCGLLRPAILLPSGIANALTPAELRAVLLHELAHLKRRDLWLNLAQTLLQIAFWFHPLLWLANARIRHLREQAVDECVLVALGAEADLYPETLVNLARLSLHSRALSFGTVGIFESRSAFAQRIQRMLARPFPRSARLGVLWSAALAALAICVLPMAEGAKNKRENPQAEVPSSGDLSAAEFIASLRILPDSNFPEYKTITNRLAREAAMLLPLLTNGLATPLPDPNNRELRTPRNTKLWALSLMGHAAKPAIPLLIKELEMDDPAGHRGPHYADHPPAFWAATVLGEIGPDASNAVPALIEAAHFRNYKAVPALAKIAPGNPEVVALAIETLRDRTTGYGGNISFSRLAGVEALATLAPGSATGREALNHAILDDDEFVRNAAARQVRMLELPGSDAALAKALADPATRVRTAAALARAGDRRDAVRTALLEALDGEANLVLAIEALAEFGELAPEAAPKMLRFLDAKENSLRLAALRALLRFPPIRESSVVIAAVASTKDPDPELRAAAPFALVHNEVIDENVLGAFDAGLRDPAAEVRSATLNAIDYARQKKIESNLASLAPHILRLLDDADNHVRSTAMMAVSNYPELADAAIPKLRAALRGDSRTSPDAAVTKGSEQMGEQAWAAVIGLGNFGAAASGAVPEMIQLLTSTNENVRGNTAIALGRMGEAAKPALAALERVTKESTNRAAFNAALSMWRIARRQEIVPILRDRLESNANWDRLELINPVTQRLFYFGVARELGADARPIIPAIKTLAAHQDFYVRRAAEEALAAIQLNTQSAAPKRSNEELFALYEPYAEHNSRSKGAAGAELIRRPDAVPFLITKLRKDRSQADTQPAMKGRQKAAVLLGKLGASAAPAVPALIQCLEDEEDVRGAATQSLGSIGLAAKEAIPTLLEELQFQNTSAAQALGRIAPASAEIQDEILALILDESKTPEFRWQSLEAMHQMQVRTPKLETALKELAESSDGNIKNAARHLLGQRGFGFGQAPEAGKTEKDIPELIAKLREDPKDYGTQIALAQIGTNSMEVLDLFIELAEKESGRLIGNIVAAIGNFGPRAAKAVPALLKATRSDSPAVAYNAIMSLNRIGPAASAAKPRLLELLGDSDPMMRWRAAAALYQIDPSQADRCYPLVAEPLLTHGPVEYWQIPPIASFGARAKEAIPHLVALLDSSDEFTRWSAATTLPKIDTNYIPRSAQTLTAILRDPRSRNPQLAAADLGKLGAQATAALSELRAAAKQTNDTMLQKAATIAIEQIEQATK